MSDSNVQVAPDSTGKLIDAQAVLNALTQLVYRQTITVGDPNIIGNLGAVTMDGEQAVKDVALLNIAQELLRELACMRMALNALANTQFHPAVIDITNR